MKIHTKQKLHYQLLFYGKSSLSNADLDLDTFQGQVDLNMPIYAYGDFTVLESQLSISNWEAIKTNGTKRMAQTFKNHSSDALLYGVRLSLNKVGSPGDLTISIRATSAGMPTGSDLVSVVLNTGLVHEGLYSKLYVVEFPTVMRLLADVTYALVLDAPGSDDTTNILYWGVQLSDAYTDGKGVYFTNSWKDYLTPRDRYFEILGEPVHFYQGLDGLGIPYEDLDGTKQLHVVLKNVDPTSKYSGYRGELVLEVEYELAG